MPKAILSFGLSTSGSIHLLHKQRKESTYLIGCYENFADGPLIPINDLAEFAGIRVGFHKETGQFSNVTRWLADIERHRLAISKADTIEIWIGTTVQEQFFLLTSLELLRYLEFDINLVKIAQFPVDIHRASLAFNTAEMLAAGPSPALIDQDAISLYNDAWLAVSDPSPEKLVQLIRQASGSLILDSALSTFFQRYPNISSGLGSLDEGILSSLTQVWTNSVYVIGDAMHRNISWLDYAGDFTLFDRLVRMSNSKLSSPMVELRGNPKQMRSCEVRITKFGRDCLEGKENNVLVNGIQDWIGGVRLSSAGNKVWHRDGQVLVSA